MVELAEGGCAINGATLFYCFFILPFYILWQLLNVCCRKSTKTKHLKCNLAVVIGGRWRHFSDHCGPASFVMPIERNSFQKKSLLENAAFLSRKKYNKVILFAGFG